MRYFILITTLIAFSSIGFSTTIHVPGDHATIQAAIDAAQNNDLILVAPGTYNEALSFDGKKITLQSVAGPESTTLICGSGYISFENNENSTSVLEGFTVTGCTTMGAIRCVDSSPFIKNNIIRDNISLNSENGGGIFCGDFTAPVIMFNRIENNRAEAGPGGAAYGGGVYVGLDSSPVFEHNVISNNLVSGGATGTGLGGGIYCIDTSFPYVIKNTIIGNEASHGFSGIYTGDGHTIVGNIITGNKGTAVTCKKNALLSNNTIADNDGPGIEFSSPLPGETIRVVNNILWNNNGGEIVLGGMAGADVTYCNIDGGWPGTGNISMAPRFVDSASGNYHLVYESPGIDAGDNAAGLSKDLDGDVRTTDGNGNGTAIIDIGADEFMTLDADYDLLTASVGGVIEFSLDSGVANAGRTYLIVASGTGSAPGLPLPGGHVELPIVWDGFTEFVLARVNTPLFQGFLGTLDSNGKASATLNTGGPLPPRQQSIPMHFAFTMNDPFDFVSHSTRIWLVP